jgi:hypothetical protein
MVAKNWHKPTICQIASNLLKLKHFLSFCEEWKSFIPEDERVRNWSMVNYLSVNVFLVQKPNRSSDPMT